MRDFPVELLQDTHADIFSAADLDNDAGRANIEIHFKPFELPLSEEPDEVGDQNVIAFDRPVRLDFIRLPSLKLAELQGKTFDFPVNPQDGYIDGSVYFMNCHNPVDVTRISFGSLNGDRLPVSFETNWLMEFESTGFKDFSCIIETEIVRTPEKDLSVVQDE